MRNWRAERAACMLRHCMRALSAQVRYAICGIFDLAYNADMKPVQLRVIGERQNIPPRYLEQIFQRLRKAGLVEGKRGPGGGYTLLRGTAEITLRDVVEAVEGPILGGETRNPKRAAAAGESGAEVVAEGQSGTPSFLWEDLAQRFALLLAETTIEDLCQESVKRGVPRATAQYLTYQI